MHEALGDAALDQLFRAARTRKGWESRAVSQEQLRQLYDLLKLGPTSANCSPARFVFCTSPDARNRLAACCSEGNAEKIRQAPVTVIIGMDLEFWAGSSVETNFICSLGYWTDQNLFARSPRFDFADVCQIL